ncbi:MAG: phage tail protein [Cyanobacteria bacterium SBLK]|nr:phage tail protein [Cyanobacteria bacterium SBLK]
MVIVKLGNLEFEAHKIPIAPIKRTRSLNFPEQDKLEGKPTLQQVGGKLETINLELTLNSMLVDVSDYLDRICSIFNSATEQDLYIGDNYEGQWIIEEMTETSKNILRNNEGWKPTNTEISLKLKEYISREPSALSGLNNILAGFPKFR